MGYASGGNGTVTIDDDAQVNLTGDGAVLDVGNRGSGQVTIMGGSDVVVENSTSYDAVRVGRNDGGSGTLTVTGTGTTLIAGDGTVSGSVGAIRVGREGDGVLEVLAGAEVSGFFLDVGRGSNTVGGLTAEGTVRIDGNNSKLLLSNDFGNFSDSEFSGEGAFARFRP